MQTETVHARGGVPVTDDPNPYRDRVVHVIDVVTNPTSGRTAATGRDVVTDEVVTFRATAPIAVGDTRHPSGADVLAVWPPEWEAVTRPHPEDPR